MIVFARKIFAVCGCNRSPSLAKDLMEIIPAIGGGKYKVSLKKHRYSRGSPRFARKCLRKLAITPGLRPDTAVSGLALGYYYVAPPGLQTSGDGSRKFNVRFRRF